MKRNRTFVIFAVSLFFLFILGNVTIIDLYTNWLFFNELNYSGVFTKILSTKIILATLFSLFSIAFILINVITANRSNFSPINLILNEQAKISLNIEMLNKWVKPLSLILGIISGLFIGIGVSSIWQEVLTFQNRINVGISDPIFSKDIGFYLFELPLFESIKGFSGFLITATLFIVSLNYLLRGGIASREKNILIDKKIKKHLGILAGLLIINTAIGFYLDQYNLLFSKHSIIFGAGYADIHARFFILRLLIVLTLLSGVLLILGVFKGSWKMAFLPLGLTAIVYAVGFMIYPALLQNLKVTPNELVLEKEFIEHHIKFTRFGYDLERIEVRPFDVSYNLTAEDIEKNNATIKNIRLWDDAPLLRTNSQLQQIRTYYKFNDVDNDRYNIDGQYMQIMLSPRELSYDDLPSKSWINEKIVFTHGIGITMSPVSRISREGLPEFIVKDIPPVSSVDIKITRPEIYFGELSSDYVIVKTKVPEFDYPTSEGNIHTSYEGSGGVEISSFLKKSVFAMKFNTAKFILSSDITPKSRVLYNRNIIDRVRRIAPFLLYDSDPYIVVSEDGKLFWIVDAYTISNRVPYSKPLNKNINYMRNSVKVLVDSYNGSVKFYVSDPEDVIIKVYSAIFPELFKPMSEIQDDLRKHVRYPKGFLQVQATMYSTFHMTDPKVFYNKEDLWEIPAYSDKTIEPYYTIMKLPEEKKEEYILLLPYTPSKRDNLAAWLSARCDEPEYGKLIVYTFPRDRLVFGPRQIDARIDQDSYISQQLTLWGQRGSQVIRGSLLVIPIESSLLYVQPLYLAAEDKGGLPEMRRVILAYENNVVMEENLELGLQRLFERRGAFSTREKVTEDIRGSINELAKEAMRTFERANELLRQGDWTGYGEQIKKLGQILRKMSK
ncbi:MAG: hypothetical protein A2Y97_09190 [Nitrospirae bacterium RBG_13_39_12]|nr:MAG: hypothetical protein A2Y97_09190 [Nitrospirae bacterium RBG_13_39_12]